MLLLPSKLSNITPIGIKGLRSEMQHKIQGLKLQFLYKYVETLSLVQLRLPAQSMTNKNTSVFKSNKWSTSEQNQQ